ncbi:MAG: hypothetical protein ACJAYU_000686 [Bradymonadia bacterium]|jgi:hypothetical protein
MLTFPEAVDLFKAEDLSDADLYRTIMAHSSWAVVAEEAEGHAMRLGVVATPNGGRILELFSSEKALELFCVTEEEERPAKMLQLAGFQLFSTLEDGAVHRINLDLHSPHATHFLVDQIPLLRAWAEVVSVEIALAAPERLPNPLAVLKRFDGFNVVIRQSGPDRDLVMAPDSEGRLLAAVFTAEDTVDEFIKEVADDLGGGLEIVRMSGQALFEWLQQIPLDGIVFNPLTHVPPIALSAAIGERILEA